MNSDFHRDGGGRFAATGAPTAKRIEVWLPPDALDAIDQHCQQHGVGRGKAIAAMLAGQPLGAAALPPPTDHQGSGADRQGLDSTDPQRSEADHQGPDGTVIQATVGVMEEMASECRTAGWVQGAAAGIAYASHAFSIDTGDLNKPFELPAEWQGLVSSMADVPGWADGAEGLPPRLVQLVAMAGEHAARLRKG